ncbi:MAG: hypothetical protein HOE48_04515, partial [Candidatus Latescibacteria bacterium]|nr:hypothetical protein [Candidatus Latescibacterota bacterium]
MAPSEQTGLSVARTTVPIQHFKQQMAKAHRWYDVVRCLRTFYDHFRIAFPHLEALPKSYTDDWAEQFKETAREFVRTEDMQSVQKVLAGAGYGTDKWVHIPATEAAEIERAFARLIEAVEHVDDEDIDDETYETDKSSNVTEIKVIPLNPSAESEEAFKTLQLKYNDSRKENNALSSEIETQQKCITELEGQIRRQNNNQTEEIETVQIKRDPQDIDETQESETLQNRLEEAKRENHDYQEEIETQAQHIAALQSQIRRLENTDIDTDEISPILQTASKSESNPPESNPSELSTLQHRYNTLLEDHQELQEVLGKKDIQIHNLNIEMKKLLANFEKVSESAPDTTQKRRTPSSMAAQIKDYEQKFKANDLLIQGLRSELERAQQGVEEYKDEIQRQRERRRIFEEEMEEERQSLREQMNKLKMLLTTEDHEALSLEELEEMESKELLTYVEDVETEKQRALAGLDALDAQDESYQKQLDAQQSELGVIQQDLDRYKESNLATEIEKTEKTVDAQRDQLETLLSFSKNLKAQVAHLKERQDPMRGLIERLNLQEKALIRYIRINHDRGFMPSQAYEKQE